MLANLLVRTKIWLFMLLTWMLNPLGSTAASNIFGAVGCHLQGVFNCNKITA